MTTSDFSTVPFGLYLCRMLHTRTGRHCLHVSLKAHAGPWHEQPAVPFYSQHPDGGEDTVRYPEFWEWAEKNLPIYEYPHPV